MSLAVDKPKNRTADSLFPPDKYVNKPGVVVFAEHSTRLRDGTPVTYDREALEKIARNCNRRIEETGNYAAVCIGHTTLISRSSVSQSAFRRSIIHFYPPGTTSVSLQPASPRKANVGLPSSVWSIHFTDRATTAQLRC